MKNYFLKGAHRLSFERTGDRQEFSGFSGAADFAQLSGAAAGFPVSPQPALTRAQALGLDSSPFRD